MAGKVRKLTVSEGIALGGAPTPDLIPAEDVSFDPTGTQFASVQVQALGEEIDDILDLKADLVGGLVPASQLPSYVDDVLEFADFASFPVTGESGKIYVALDTNFTYRWTGSIYVLLGGASGGGSGSGEINYITNPDAENDSAGWADYDDVGVSEPIDGDGGTAANLTFTRQNVTVVRGEFSFKLAKAAADAQGEGLSTDFTIDTADRNKLLKIGFDYNTDGTYTNEDIKVYIYDVTNATLITPADNGIIGVDKDSSSSGSRTIGWSSTDSLEYRLIFHITEGTSNPYDFYFDNVIVGPGSVAITNETAKTVWVTLDTSIMTGDEGFSDTGSRIQVARDSNGEYTAEVHILGTKTSNNNNVVLTFTGLAFIDDQAFSFKNESLAGSRVDTTTTIYYGANATTAICMGNGILRLSGKPDWFDANRDQSTVNLMSDNVAAANARIKYTGASVVGGANTEFAFATEVYKEGGMTIAAGIVTVPTAGKYLVESSITTTADALNAVYSLEKNSSNYFSTRPNGPATGALSRFSQVSYTIELAAGDTVGCSLTVARTLTSDAAQNYISVTRIADYSAGQPVGFGLATADTAGLIPNYEFYTFELDNNFTGGDQTVEVVKIGRQVTLTVVGAVTFSSSNEPVSSTGLLPTRFRPASTQSNIVGLANSSHIDLLQVVSDGQVKFLLRTEALGGSAQTTTQGGSSITYTVAAT